MRGPDRLASEYLATLRADGYVVMPALLAPQMMAAMKQHTEHGQNILVHMPQCS
jgi:hypothetical protein